MATELSKRDARRIAVRAQWLDLPRPPDLLAFVRRATLLQLDPTSAIAPSADLVLWSRLGDRYRRADLMSALEQRELIEVDAMLRPAEDLVQFRGRMAQWPVEDWQSGIAVWASDNASFARDILARLEADGPLLSRDLPDSCVRPWRSTGWTNNRNVTQMLEVLVARGQVAVAGRQGKQRLWDLASRIYPDEPHLPIEQAVRARNERRLRALGLARAKAAQAPMEPTHVGEVGDEVTVQGVPGTWRADPAQLDRLGERFRGRAALLSPFDRILHDRKRLAEVFEYEYILEMYKPAASRRWGYYALPVLVGDAFVGKLDATADRKAGALRVNAMHWESEPTATVRSAVDGEIEALASWLELDLVR